MILTIEEARDVLRLDGGDNDELIMSLLHAIPGYIEVTTGCCNWSDSLLAKTVAKFLLQLWYNADGTDTERLQRTIDNLLTALTIQARR